MEIMKCFKEFKSVSDMQVLYVQKTGNYNQSAMQAWKKLFEYISQNNLENEQTLHIGTPLDNPNITPEEKLRYNACITYSGEFKPVGEIGIKTIQGGNHATFLHKGPYELLYDFYNAIFMEWLPKSEKVLRELPPFEIYLNDPKITKSEDLETLVHIPIQ